MQCQAPKVLKYTSSFSFVLINVLLDHTPCISTFLCLVFQDLGFQASHPCVRTSPNIQLRHQDSYSPKGLIQWWSSFAAHSRPPGPQMTLREAAALWAEAQELWGNNQPQFGSSLGLREGKGCGRLERLLSCGAHGGPGQSRVGEEAGEETQLNAVGPPHSFPQLSLDRCETTTRTLASQALHPQHSLSWSLCLQQVPVLLPDLMQVPREPTTWGDFFKVTQLVKGSAQLSHLGLEHVLLFSDPSDKDGCWRRGGGFIYVHMSIYICMCVYLWIHIYIIYVCVYL